MVKRKKLKADRTRWRKHRKDEERLEVRKMM